MNDILHPGTYIRALFDEKMIRQNLFAKRIGMQPTQLNEMLKGKRRISPEFAIALEEYFAVTAEFILEMQTKWEVHQLKSIRDLRKSGDIK